MRKLTVFFALWVSLVSPAFAQQTSAGEAWWFLHQATFRSGNTTVVGPFKSEQDCKNIAKQSIRDKQFYHVTDCWLGPVPPAVIGR
jgi:hypothetical protein